MDEIDLRTGYPRSPRAELDGIKILPRAIDKARAQLAGTLGDYVYYQCGINRVLFDALDVTDDDFLDAVREVAKADSSPASIDAAVVRWIRSDLRTPQKRIDEMNATIVTMEPQTPEQRAYLRTEVEAVAPGRTDITRFVDLLDLQEGRIAA